MWENSIRYMKIAKMHIYRYGINVVILVRCWTYFKNLWTASYNFKQLKQMTAKTTAGTLTLASVEPVVASINSIREIPRTQCKFKIIKIWFGILVKVNILLSRRAGWVFCVALSLNINPANIYNIIACQGVCHTHLVAESRTDA